MASKTASRPRRKPKDIDLSDESDGPGERSTVVAEHKRTVVRARKPKKEAPTTDLSGLKSRLEMIAGMMDYGDETPDENVFKRQNNLALQYLRVIINSIE